MTFARGLFSNIDLPPLSVRRPHETNTPASNTVTPVVAADLLAEAERMPVYVNVIDQASDRVLSTSA